MFTFWKKDWKCGKCSKLNHDSAAFCEFCGNPRVNTAAAHFTHEPADDCVRTTIQQSRRQPQAETLIECASCGHVCGASERFCSSCGLSLTDKETDTTPVHEIVPLVQYSSDDVLCMHCGTKNPAHNRFCSHCSQELRVRAPIAAEAVSHPVNRACCPECGAFVTGNSPFCNECGTRISISQTR